MSTLIVAAIAGVLCGLVPLGPPQSEPLPFAELSAALQALADEHDGASVLSLGTTPGERDLLALVIATGDRPLDERTGILVVGEPVGNRPVDSTVILATARRLLADENLNEALGRHALVLIPRPAPDGTEHLLTGEPRRQRAGNGRPDDADRDGRIDEDGPTDLNGDGFITTMRVPDPEGSWVIDEFDPRAMRKAKRAEGERGTHKLMSEGRDDDGDGEINEDDDGGVIPDKNFPHGWQDHDAPSGAYPLSEPESRALARFVLDHPGLSLVVVVGSQDTLVETPKAADKAERGGFFNRFRAPLMGLYEDDVETMEEFSRRLGKALDEHDAKGDAFTDGSFVAWSYHEAGRWPLALRPWAPPEDFPEDEEEEEEADDDEAPDDDEEQTVEDEAEAMDATDEIEVIEDVEVIEDMDAIEEIEVVEDEEAPEDDDEPAEDEDDESDEPEPTSDKESPAPAAVLAWLDQEYDGEGFRAWESFEHPELGTVEIGGLLPGLLDNGPHGRASDVADGLAAFLTDLLGAMPDVAFESVEVEARASGLYVLEAALVNTGALPTGTKYAADAGISRPIRVTLELPEGAELMNGPTQVLVPHLAAAGGRHELRWVIAGEPGSTVTLHADADTVMDIDLEVTLP